MNAIMKYPGSKWSIADWIVSFFPPHHTYLEPFFGSGALLFTKPRSNIETVNDLDDNVVNLFNWIRDDPEKLAHAIYWTPYARQVYNAAFDSVPEDSLGRAVNFYIRLNMGHGFRTTGERVGWKSDIQGRERAYASQDWCNLPGKIMQAAERLRGVQIEHQPALELIKRYNSPKVLIYLDPPYLLETRCGRQQYRYDMMDRESHVELLQAAIRHKGPVLISWYESQLYDDMLQGWHKEAIACQNMACDKTREILWMNFEPVRQLEIGDMLGGGFYEDRTTRCGAGVFRA